MKTTLKTAKFCAETAKWWCKNGEIVVLWRRFHDWLQHVLSWFAAVSMYYSGCCEAYLRWKYGAEIVVCDTISSFSSTNFPTFTYHFGNFHDAITSISEHEFPVSELWYKVLRTKSPNFKPKFPHFPTQFRQIETQFPHFHTPFRQLNIQIDRFPTRICRFQTPIARFHLFFRRLRCLFAAVLRQIAMKARWNCGCLAAYTSGFHVFFRRLQGLFTVKIWCGNGKIVVYLRRVHAWFPEFLLPMWRNSGAIAAVSNPDFPNFTKHSTVLTSILQQINTLYQHFPSAKTAKPALETAKFTLKNRRKQC